MIQIKKQESEFCKDAHDKEEVFIAKTRLDNLKKAWPSNLSTMPGSV